MTIALLAGRNYIFHQMPPLSAFETVGGGILSRTVSKDAIDRP